MFTERVVLDKEGGKLVGYLEGGQAGRGGGSRAGLLNLCNNANRLGVGVGPRKAAPLGIPGSFPGSPKPFPFRSRIIPEGCGYLPTPGPGSGPIGEAESGVVGPNTCQTLVSCVRAAIA